MERGQGATDVAGLCQMQRDGGRGEGEGGGAGRDGRGRDRSEADVGRGGVCALTRVRAHMRTLVTIQHQPLQPRRASQRRCQRQVRSLLLLRPALPVGALSTVCGMLARKCKKLIDVACGAGTGIGEGSVNGKGKETGK